MIVRVPTRRDTEFLLLPSLFLISLNATFFNYDFSILFQIIEVVYIQAELNFRSYIETGSLTFIQISMINMNRNEGPGKAKPLDQGPSSCPLFLQSSALSKMPFSLSIVISVFIM